MPVEVKVRRDSARSVERVRGRLTRHGFSFGSGYDPQWLGLGPLVCHDDHLLGSGQGFDTHPHRDLDIVTWVVSGTLVHTDASGSREVPAGSVAVQVCGDGIEHAERASVTGPCRFVQMWLRSEATEPAYHLTSPALVAGALTEVARLDSGAVLSVGQLAGNESLTLPAAPLLHAYVVTGALLRSSLAEPLHAGDAFVMTNQPEHSITAGVPTQLLVWRMPSA